MTDSSEPSVAELARSLSPAQRELLDYSATHSQPPRKSQSANPRTVDVLIARGLLNRDWTLTPLGWRVWNALT